MASGTQLHTFPVSSGPLWDLAYTPAGDRLAVRSDGAIYVLDAPTGIEAYRITPMGGVEDFAIVPGVIAIVESGATDVWLYNLAAGAPLTTLSMPLSQPILAIALSPDGNWLAALDEGGTVAVVWIGP